MNARKSRIIRKMTKGKHGNRVYRAAKAAYSHQPHGEKSFSAAVEKAKR